jgi:hypothetical protein
MAKIDWEELCEAIGDYSRTHHRFLNKNTGEILILSDYMSQAAKTDMKKRTEGSQLSDYALVPPMASRESYRMLEDFIRQMGDEKLKKQLTEALTDETPFKSFKELVFNHPEERKRWIEFREHDLLDRAKKWLKEMGVDY